MHQLPVDDDAGEFVANGVITGLAGFIMTGDSGLESVGFSVVVEVVGTVVIGVVMSICLVEIGTESCNFLSSLYASFLGSVVLELVPDEEESRRAATR